MISAFVYLQVHSAINRVRTRLKRLKQPKYLAGAIVGGLYFYFYFFRYFFHRNAGALPLGETFSLDLALMELVAALILAVLLCFGWILPNRRAALNFSEAEIAFLFPAPISRRRLIQFKLLKSQNGILFSSLIFTLVSGRFGRGGHAWIHALGWWIILSTAHLHLLAVSFARSKWFGLDPRAKQRQAGALVAMVAAAAALILWGREILPGLVDPQEIAGALQRWIQRAPVPQLLFPFRWVVRPYLSQTGSEFLFALGPALLLLALHYEWVIRSDVAFEEASVDLARQTAETVAADPLRRRLRSSASRKPRRVPFQLDPSGSAPVAFLWKNLIGASQTFSGGAWLIVGIVLAGLVWWSRSTHLAILVRGFLLGVLPFTLLVLPQALRMDLREDLAVADLLKGLPVPGWQIIFGELLAPVMIQTVAQYFVVLLLGISVIGTPTGFPAMSWVAAALLAPFLNVLLFLVANGSVVLFPAWIQTGKEAARGIEATGQRLIFVFGQVLVIFVAAIPAAIAFGGAYFSFGWLSRNAGFAAGTAASMVVLGVEIGLAIGWLGRQFERLDISRELTI